MNTGKDMVGRRFINCCVNLVLGFRKASCNACQESKMPKSFSLDSHYGNPIPCHLSLCYLQYETLKKKTVKNKCPIFAE